MIFILGEIHIQEGGLISNIFVTFKHTQWPSQKAMKEIIMDKEYSNLIDMQESCYSDLWNFIRLVTFYRPLMFSKREERSFTTLLKLNAIEWRDQWVLNALNEKNTSMLTCFINFFYWHLHIRMKLENFPKW